MLMILDIIDSDTDQEAYWSSFTNTYNIWAEVPYKRPCWEVFVVLPAWEKCL